MPKKNEKDKDTFYEKTLNVLTGITTVLFVPVIFKGVFFLSTAVAELFGLGRQGAKKIDGR